jgi:mRNA interferase RelE/StbE
MVSKALSSVKWSFEFSVEASDQFDCLDQAVQVRVRKKLQKIMESKVNPATFFKRLTGNMHHLYSLRIGDYRLICQIKGTEMVILALHIGHRRDVYEL